MNARAGSSTWSAACCDLTRPCLDGAPRAACASARTCATRSAGMGIGRRDDATVSFFVDSHLLCVGTRCVAKKMFAGKGYWTTANGYRLQCRRGCCSCVLPVLFVAPRARRVSPPYPLPRSRHVRKKEKSANAAMCVTRLTGGFCITRGCYYVKRARGPSSCISVTPDRSYGSVVVEVAAK